MKPLILLLIFILLIPSIAICDSINLSRFSTTPLSEWKEKSFKGQTAYSLVPEGAGTVLAAHSKGSASGLYMYRNLDPREYRYLRWSWKVGTTLDNHMERTKGGDDYAARVYVIFPGFFFWQMKAICYVWASTLPVGTHFPNPHTGNAHMVVVESGTAPNRGWRHEERDVLADFRTFFGGEPRRIGAVAVMTDTDNSGGEASAWYGDIFISNRHTPENNSR